MNVDHRQRARDRAADAVATREQVKIGPNDWWPGPLLDGPGLSEQERRKLARRRSRAKQRSVA